MFSPLSPNPPPKLPPPKLPPQEQKAVAGLRYRVLDIDARVNVLYNKIATSSFFRWIINKLGLGREIRQIKALNQEKAKIQNAIKDIFGQPEAADVPPLPTTSAELQKEKEDLTLRIQELESKIRLLVQEYEEALFLKNLFEIGLADDFPSGVIKNMELLLADLKGLQYNLTRCEVDGPMSLEYIKNQAIKALPGADAGRSVLLTEMRDHPDILVDDITRQGKVTIGEKSFTLAKLPSNTPAYVRNAMAQEIRNYVASKNEEIKLSDDTITEFLFSLMQQFLRPLFLQVSHDFLVNSKEGEQWASLNAVFGRNVSFDMEKKTPANVLIITVQDEKVFINVNDETKTKPVVLEMQTHYNLATKEVMFYQSYTIDGKTTTLDPTKNLVLMDKE